MKKFRHRFLMVCLISLMAMGHALADDDADTMNEHIPSATGYMSEIQAMTDKFKPEWRSCASDDDCDLISYDCAHLAVAANHAHMQEAEDVVCKTEMCEWMECAPHAYSYTAACVQGLCAIQSKPVDFN